MIVALHVIKYTANFRLKRISHFNTALFFGRVKPDVLNDDNGSRVRQ